MPMNMTGADWGVALETRGAEQKDDGAPRFNPHPRRSDPSILG